MVLLAIAGIEIYCMILLVKCSRTLGLVSYGEIVERATGRIGGWSVDASLVLSQLGFVCAEMLYVSTNGQNALASFSDSLPSWLVLTQGQLLMGQLLLSVPLSWIRHLRYFKVTNIIANATVLVALGALLVISAKGLAREGPGPDIHEHGPGWLMFAGTSVFSFECINFVLPMYEAHEKPETFVPILSSTLCLVALMFVGFGGLNYMYYGCDTEDVLTLNLPKDSPSGKVMPFAFSLASLLNVPLFLFPASITIEAKCFEDARRPSLARKWKKNGLRTLLIG